MKGRNLLLTLASASTLACCYAGNAETLNPTAALPGDGVEVVGSLDAPIPSGSNAIWCASFLAAWKELAGQVTGEAISLEGAPALAASLNAAADPRRVIPQQALYASAGWITNGIIERIRKEMSQRFPAKEPPQLSALDTSAIAYSYLEANVKFPLPYFQNRQPLEFTDAEGRKTEVASFGIGPEDHNYELSAQVQVLFRKESADEMDFEFAIDLGRDSRPSQIVVARIKREPTLAAAVARVEREIKAVGSQPDYGDELQRMGANDVLLVPEVLLQLSHHFAELEGRDFLNAKLKGEQLGLAQQDILFRLDRSGAELKSESKLAATHSVSTRFVFDRPFLIFMRKRGLHEPYLALWVDNVQLLSAFQKASEAQRNAAPNAAPPHR
jgi:hypothetical protein